MPIRLKKWLKRMGLTLVLLVAVLFTALAIYNAYWDSKAASKLQALIDAQQPTTLMQLYKAGVPDEENAYWQLCQIAQEANDFELEIEGNEETHDPSEPLILERTEKALAAHPTLMAGIQRVAECPRWARPKSEYGDIRSMVDTRSYHSIRPLIRVLNRVGTLAISQQDGALASRCLFQGLAISDRQGTDENIIDLLIRNACRGLLWDLASRELSAKVLSPEDRQRLLLAAQNVDAVQELHSCFVGERVVGLEHLAGFSKRMDYGLLRLSWGRETCAYIDLTERLMGATSADVFDGFKKVVDKDSLPALLRISLTPGFESVAASLARQMARQRCLVMVIKLSNLADEVKEGFDLKRLGLEPVWTTDPYSNRPLVVKRTAGGWHVYAVGVNLRDDEGKLNPPSEDDIGLWLDPDHPRDF